jgi:hypothetical protein
MASGCLSGWQDYSFLFVILEWVDQTILSAAAQRFSLFCFMAQLERGSAAP